MSEQDDQNEAFPWHLGVYDAHCHPTDTMSSIATIPGMSCSVLTIMATRAKDQELVAQTADEYGVQSRDFEGSTTPRRNDRVVPSFGWHPWFSHQLYNDLAPGPHNIVPGRKCDDAAKLSHYRTVLTGEADDEEFVRSLPDPTPLSEYLRHTKDYLERFPLALVGEIGLDRAFRLPTAWTSDQEGSRDSGQTPGGREGRKLSPYRVRMEHQREVFKAQLSLARNLERAVSVHSVQTHGLVFETLKGSWNGYEKEVISKRQRKRSGSDPRAYQNEGDSDGDTTGNTAVQSSGEYPSRICLHSYSGPPESLKQYFHPSVPAEVFFSFSYVINMPNGLSKKLTDAIKAVPDNRILVETDLNYAGESLDRLLEQIIRTICGIKNWKIEEGVRQLGKNWKRFVFGSSEGQDRL